MSVDPYVEAEKQESGVAELEARIERLEGVVVTLIGWMGQSANSPLSFHEVETLLKLIRE